MTNDVSTVLFIILGIQLIIIIMFYLVFSSIDKNTKRTNYLLKLLYEKDGTKMTNEQINSFYRL